MNKADMYQQVNDLQKLEAKTALEYYANKFKWRLDGKDSLLDAGCGGGDITHNFVLPMLPSNFTRLVGVDISYKMLHYARKTYVHPKLSFEYFDLNTELEKQSFRDTELFDHIFSSFCLMWIPNQRICINNFYKLLNANGDMLLVFVANTKIFDAYKELSQSARWASYMYDADQIISPYQYSDDPASDFRNLLNESGFRDCEVNDHESRHIFNIIKAEKFLISINPFIDRIPSKDQPAYTKDLLTYFVRNGCALGDFFGNRESCRIIIPYTVTVAFARKC